MKILEKFALIIYSFFMLVISALICLLIFGVIDTENITNGIKFVLEEQSIVIIVLAVSISFILLSIRCLFFRKRKEVKKSNANDILLENESGRLLISKRAIENAIKNIINDIMVFKPENKVVADIDPANNVSVYISIFLEKNVNIKDLSIGLQIKIKEKIKEDFGLDVKQVNIKIDSTEKEIVKLEKEDKKEITKDKNDKTLVEGKNI